MHEGVGPAQMPRHGQHHADGLLRHGHGIGPRRVHDRDALMRRGFEVNIVHADSGAPDHSQLPGVFE